MVVQNFIVLICFLLVLLTVQYFFCEIWLRLLKRSSVSLLDIVKELCAIVIKAFGKENIVPEHVNRKYFVFVPILMLTCMMIAWCMMPVFVAQPIITHSYSVLMIFCLQVLFMAIKLSTAVLLDTYQARTYIRHMLKEYMFVMAYYLSCYILMGILFGTFDIAYIAQKDSASYLVLPMNIVYLLVIWLDNSGCSLGCNNDRYSILCEYSAISRGMIVMSERLNVLLQAFLWSIFFDVRINAWYFVLASVFWSSLMICCATFGNRQKYRLVIKGILLGSVVYICFALIQ